MRDGVVHVIEVGWPGPVLAWVAAAIRSFKSLVGATLVLLAGAAVLLLTTAMV